MHRNNVNAHRNDIKKSTWKLRGFFDKRNHIKKVYENNEDFSASEITSKKVRGNNLDFSTSKITSKKYVEMMWKFVKIWSLTYQCNTDIRSTSV